MKMIKNHSIQTAYIQGEKLLLLVIFLTVILFSLFIVRLADVQLYRGQHFLAKAEDNRQFAFKIPAPRGVFLDRYGDNLVYNQKLYYQLADDKNLFSAREYLTDNQARQVMATQSAFLPYQLARFYLYPESTAHVLGYLAPVSQADLTANPDLELTDKVGKLALEKSFENQLRGVKGKEIFEIDTFGKKKRVLSLNEAKFGNSIQTTLDPYLSQIAYQSMEGKTGTVLIGDAKTGEILALVNRPSFSNNDLSNIYLDLQAELERKTRVNNYFSENNTAFFNRAVSGVYPPGSIFKLVTALAALESGKIDENTIVVDEGILKVGEFEYDNWYAGAEGAIGVVKAIARSNDIFFYKAAEFTGAEALANMARNFGLGQATGIELPGEANGLIPDPAWKERKIGEKWYLGNTYHMGIGQGDVLLTPVQILQVVQTIANNGSLCAPHLIKQDQLNCKGLSLQEKNLNLVLQGMLDACSPGGVAGLFFQQNTAHQLPEAAPPQQIDHGMVACKTGTAEFGPEDNNGHRKTHGWFVAIISGTTLMNEQMQLSEADLEQLLANQPSLSKKDDLKAYYQWREKLKTKPLPEKLVLVNLSESDEANQYRGGAGDASAVINKILTWMQKGNY